MGAELTKGGEVDRGPHWEQQGPAKREEGEQQAVRRLGQGLCLLPVWARIPWVRPTLKGQDEADKASTFWI